MLRDKLQNKVIQLSGEVEKTGYTELNTKPSDGDFYVFREDIANALIGRGYKVTERTNFQYSYITIRKTFDLL